MANQQTQIPEHLPGAPAPEQAAAEQAAPEQAAAEQAVHGSVETEPAVGGHPAPPGLRAWSGSRPLALFLEGIVAAAIVGELIVVLINIVSRLLTGNSVLWAQEVSEIAIYIIAFVGGSIAYAKGAHMSIEGLVNRLPSSWSPYLKTLSDWLVFGMGLGMAFLFGPILVQRWSERTPIMEMPAFFLSAPLELGMILVCYFALLKIKRAPLKTALVSLLVALALVAAVLGAKSIADYVTSDSILFMVLGFLFVVLFLGVPIAFVLVLGSAAYLYWGGISSVVAVPIGMQSGANSFLLLAIPFFILTGSVMNLAGLTTPLARFVDALIGHIKGGLLQVVVVTMYIFSGISGSKVADVAAVGTSMRDMLDARKIPRGEVVAVLSASAIMGETVPPSIVLLVLGSITTLSTSTLFLAGLLPAAFLGLCVMALIFLRASKEQALGERRKTWKQRGKTGFAALPTLLLPVGLILGITAGIATPTEVSAAAVAYAALLSAGYRKLSLTLAWATLTETATTAGMVLFIIAAASPFAQTLASAGVSAEIGDLMSGLQDSPFLFLLISILLLIVMGQLLEGLPAMLIFAPLLLPIATQFGINPVQYSMVLIVAMGIGSFAPPAGVGFYVASATGRESVEKSLRHFYPYLLVLFAGLILLALTPWFSTALPTLLGLSTS